MQSKKFSTQLFRPYSRRLAMKSQTSLVARQVRLNEWAEQVRDCQNRPQGMSVDTWCELHNIKKPNYYWRLRKVREACLELAASQEPAFVEVPMTPAIAHVDTSNVQNPAAIFRLSNNASLEITNDASSDFLERILTVMAHVK